MYGYVKVDIIFDDKLLLIRVVTSWVNNYIPHFDFDVMSYSYPKLDVGLTYLNL